MSAVENSGNAPITNPINRDQRLLQAFPGKIRDRVLFAAYLKDNAILTDNRPEEDDLAFNISDITRTNRVDLSQFRKDLVITTLWCPLAAPMTTTLYWGSYVAEAMASLQE